MSYKYIFGPVLSRRFGSSLGIDLSPDSKSCNFDCIYCELKAVKPQSFITSPPKIKNIIEELERALKEFESVDVITITSNGEPTLYEELDRLVDEINRIKGDKKLLILSNASTVNQPKIRDILKKIDIVKLSLDCADEKCFKKIDRPLKGMKIEEIIKGIKSFREVYDKELVIEILVVEGINDKTEQMQKLNEILNDIKPNRVDLGTIDRPPAYKVNPVKTKKLQELSKNFCNIPLSISYKKDYEVKKIDFSEDEILALLKRRPQSEDDIKRQFSQKSKSILDKLIKEKRVYRENVAGVLFYRG